MEEQVNAVANPANAAVRNSSIHVNDSSNEM